MNKPRTLESTSILLYYPFGMGDHIICQGIVREYCKKYDRVTIFAKGHNYPSVVFMYRDLPNLTVVHINETLLEVAEHSAILNDPNKTKLEFDEVKIIGLNYLVWGEKSIQFEKQLYDIAGIPLLKKWESFFVERDHPRESALFEKIGMKGDYIFLHEDPERKYIIDRNFIDHNYAIFEPHKSLTDNIFDYCTIIEKAREIHVIDSSFMFLVDCLPYDNPDQKLFVHRYARDNHEALLPILKKDWRIIVERRDRREPLKDLLSSFRTLKLPPVLSAFVFRVVRKIFWIMRWNMTRPDHPSIHHLVQRYVPGRSFAEIITGKNESGPSYVSLAKKLEAASATTTTIEAEPQDPADVVLCVDELSGYTDLIQFFTKLRSLTKEILILHTPPSDTILDRGYVESLLMMAGFSIRERHLYCTESVFVCRTEPVRPMKFSIVTPVYNGKQYLAETIESVISQGGDFEIEYIVQDGGSTDKTIEIVQSYEKKIKDGIYPIKCAGVKLIWHSEKDRGMYDAINKGFAHATGSIYAYINADDRYLPGALAAIAKTFTAHTKIEWLKGITAFARESSPDIEPGQCMIYNQAWIAKGVYGRNAYFIQQDSVFWRKELWRKAGGMNANLRYAGDYDLWIRFAAHAPLWSLNTPVSIFRKRAGQLSGDMAPYRTEQRAVYPEQDLLTKTVKLFFWVRGKMPVLQPVLDILYPLVFWRRNKYYVDIDTRGIPFIVATNRFRIEKSHHARHRH